MPHAIQHIMVFPDAELRSTSALHLAAAIARRAGARIQACIAGHEPMVERAGIAGGPDVMLLARRGWIDERQQWLQQQVRTWSGAGVAIEPEVVWSAHPSDTMLEKIADTTPDLVIKDAGEAHFGARLMMGSDDWRLAHRSPAPVAVVRSGHSELPRRVLAAVDCALDSADSIHPLNQAVLNESLRLAIYADAQVHVAFAIPREPAPSPWMRRVIDAYREVRARDLSAFTRLCDLYQVPRDRRHVLEASGPASALRRCARELETDLIVIGSGQQAWLDRAILGHTSQAVLGAAECNVLVVREPGAATALLRRASDRPGRDATLI